MRSMNVQICQFFSCSWLFIISVCLFLAQQPLPSDVQTFHLWGAANQNVCLQGWERELKSFATDRGNCWSVVSDTRLGGSSECQKKMARLLWAERKATVTNNHPLKPRYAEERLWMHYTSNLDANGLQHQTTSSATPSC